MSIPIHTTTIRVLRVPADPERDPTEAQPDAEVIAAGVRAHISTSTGTEIVAGGASQEIVNFRLSSDPADIQHTDRIEDERTGEVYEVTWARQRIGVGLDHTQAGLRQVTGVV